MVSIKSKAFRKYRGNAVGFYWAVLSWICDVRVFSNVIYWFHKPFTSGPFTKYYELPMLVYVTNTIQVLLLKVFKYRIFWPNVYKKKKASFGGKDAFLRREAFHTHRLNPTTEIP